MHRAQLYSHSLILLVSLSQHDNQYVLLHRTKLVWKLKYLVVVIQSIIYMFCSLHFTTSQEEKESFTKDNNLQAPEVTGVER